MENLSALHPLENTLRIITIRANNLKVNYKAKLLIAGLIIAFCELTSANSQDLTSSRDSTSADSLKQSTNTNITLPTNYTSGTGFLKGSLVDSITQKPLEYVTVNLKRLTDQSSKNFLSKNDGSFFFDKVSSGQYSLTIVTIGYQKRVISLVIDGTKQVWDLGKIAMFEQRNNLAEVVVTAAKPLIKMDIDRISYDVQADPQSKVETVLDMMRKVPLISIDGDDNIQVKGSSSFKILIDGRPSSLVARDPKEVFKNMAALNILRIEVITTPPAKYDSEGLAGIINIVTNKKILGGYNGSVGTRSNTAFGPGTSASLTLKNKKFGFATNGGLSHRGAQPLSFSESRSEPLSQFEQSGSRAYKGTVGYMSAELSYDIDSLNLITASMAYNKNDGNIIIGSSNNRFDQFNILNQSYHCDNTVDYRRGGYDLGLNYQLGFKRNKEQLLTVSYRFISNNDDQFAANSFYGLASPVDYRQQNESGTKEQTIQLDYAQPLKKLNIEGGLKAILRNNLSDYGMQNFNATSQTFEINTNGTNVFDYQQDVISLYNSYQLKLDNWGFKAGLRLERTLDDANFASASNQFNLDYDNFIPSISIQRKFKTSSINLGYTQRIQRPGILQLNPYEERRDKFVSSGNSELQPALSNNFDFSYNMFKKGSIVTNLSYSFTDNTIQNVTTLRRDTSYTTFANTGKNKNLSLSMNVNYPLTKKIRFYLWPLISYLKMEGIVNNKIYKNEGIQWIAYTYVNYKFAEDWQVGYNIGFQNGVMFLQGESNPYNWNVISVSKDFLKKKASLSASVYNPFKRFANWGVDTKSSEFTLRKDHAQFYRQASLSFNYRFGKLTDQLKKNKRGINNDDNSGGKNRGIVGEM